MKTGKEVEIHVTPNCKYDCVFCSVRKHCHAEPSKKELIRDINLTKGF
jgi:wyosine [tRNA(Phe)-imidazoG37] synthetase (radical SAM superfamily)